MLAAFPDLYGRLLGKRFDAGFFLEHVAREGTHGCDYLLTVDMEMEPVAGYALANWKRGYGDFHLVPDLSTLRRAAWLDGTALVVCDVRDPRDSELVPEAPRSLLRSQTAALAQAGFAAAAASELEFYVFEGTYREAARRGWRELEATGWYLEDYHLLSGTRLERLNAKARRALGASGVPIESSKGEWGLGQHELNVRYADALAMADRHVVLKQCLKEVAEGEGLSVTFMAKFAAGGAGSSCHLHLSLWSDGENAFAGDQAFGPLRCSDVFRSFLAGWIERVPDLMVFYAPTVNSYKRYRAASWAPTGLAWSLDNRTAGFRVVGAGPSFRIECRLPGADCNPYLAFAAALASGLDGIRRGAEPPPPFQGNAYEDAEVPRVPASLAEALSRFEASEFARSAFGDRVVDHYAHFFRTEQAAFDAAVTDWERQRYFERI